MMNATGAQTPVDLAAVSAGTGPRGRRALLPVVLVVLLALVAGLAAGSLLGRPRYPGTESVEAGFARDMSVHHGQAVEMSATVHASTQDPEVRRLAVDIMLTQQAQIGIFATWLRTWDVPLTGDGPPMAWMSSGSDGSGGSHGSGRAGGMAMGPGADGLMPGMATDAELARLRAATGRAQDVLWCQLMLRHHLGGVDMARVAVDRAEDRQVRELARQVEQGQAAEVTVLQGLLTRLGAEPLPAR